MNTRAKHKHDLKQNSFDIALQQLDDNSIDAAGQRAITICNAADELLEALMKCENVLGLARAQGKLSNNGFSPVSDAIIAARRAIDKTRGR